MLKQVAHQLAHLIGPVAHLMVRRAAAWTDDLDDLYWLLADRLADRDERAMLLEGRNRLMLPAPPANAAAFPVVTVSQPE